MREAEEVKIGCETKFWPNGDYGLFLTVVIYRRIYNGVKQTSSADVLQQIAQIQRMEPGKLCVIGQGPNGPYYNLQCREGGKTVSRYVPADQVQAVAGHTANYQKFQALVAQYAQTVIAQTREERAAGSKKKSRPRSGSSWPRNKKSNK